MNTFDSALSRLTQAAKYESLPEWFLETLSVPERTIQLNFPVKRDSGKIEIMSGYRVQYNNLLGPYKGGLRFHTKVDMDEVKSLAFWMMIKNAVINIPFGGGKGGVEVNPKDLSKAELERLTRQFTKKLAPNIGPYTDVPAPDVNTNAKIMDWITDEFRVRSEELKIKYNENESKAVVTGKSVENGGSLGREEATGLGGFFVLEQLIKKLDFNKPLTVAVQGFGNVGSHMAALLFENGYKVVGLSDSKGGIVEQSGKGFNVNSVKSCKLEKGLISSCSPINISNEELFEMEVDILIPAALENVITSENANKIKAKIVFEMANGPVMAEADEILKEKGIIVVPDVLANSGGVTVSYFEWLQNIEGKKWTLEEVNKKLQEKMETAFEEVWKMYAEKKVDLRTAAYVLALQRLAQKAGL